MTKPAKPRGIMRVIHTMFPQFARPITDSDAGKSIREVDHLPPLNLEDVERDHADYEDRQRMKRRLFMEHYGAKPETTPMTLENITSTEQGTEMHRLIEEFFAANPKLRTDALTAEKLAEDSVTSDVVRNHTIATIAEPLPLIFDCMDCEFKSLSMTDAQQHMIDTLATARVLKVPPAGHSIDTRFATPEEMK